MVMAIMSFYPTLAPHLSDCGYSVTFAALMTSISMGALAIGKVTLGRMFDKLGNRKAVTIACACTLAGTIAMIFCTSPIALAFIVLGVGLGCSFGAVCMPIIVQNIFGMKDYNSIYSKLTVATNLGSALAPVITGRTYDVCGSYVPAYIGVAVLTVISIVILRIYLPKEK
jgi:MFS family permease